MEIVAAAVFTGPPYRPFRIYFALKCASPRVGSRAGRRAARPAAHSAATTRGEEFMTRQLLWALLAGGRCPGTCARHESPGRANDHEPGVCGPDVGQGFLTGGMP